MNANDWIFVILLGGILGTVGQGIRVVTGLAKANSEVAAQNAAGNGSVKFGDVFDMKQLIVSLVVGFVAGALAAVTLGLKANEAIDTKTILGLVAAGYTGADFIEGIVRSFSIKPQPQTQPQPQIQAAAVRTT